MKLFPTSDISVIKYCQELIHFELPSIMLYRDVRKKLKLNIEMFRLF